MRKRRMAHLYESSFYGGVCMEYLCCMEVRLEALRDHEKEKCMLDNKRATGSQRRNMNLRSSRLWWTGSGGGSGAK